MLLTTYYAPRWHLPFSTDCNRTWGSGDMVMELGKFVELEPEASMVLLCWKVRFWESRITEAGTIAAHLLLVRVSSSLGLFFGPQLFPALISFFSSAHHHQLNANKSICCTSLSTQPYLAEIDLFTFGQRASEAWASDPSQQGFIRWCIDSLFC